MSHPLTTNYDFWKMMECDEAIRNALKAQVFTSHTAISMEDWMYYRTKEQESPLVTLSSPAQNDNAQTSDIQLQLVQDQAVQQEALATVTA